MRLLVVGAGGEMGQAVVEQAVTRGHQVTAFMHHRQESTPSGIRVLVGDARDRNAILQALQGQDVVLDTLGSHNPFPTTTLETDAAETITSAMREVGIRRLIAVSTIGEGESIQNVHGYYKHLFMNTILRGVMKDKAGLEDVVEHSGLDWILVRPAGLKNGEPKGVHVVDPQSGEKVRFITRADVAHFMLDQLESDAYLHQAVGIANLDE